MARVQLLSRGPMSLSSTERIFKALSQSLTLSISIFITACTIISPVATLPASSSSSSTTASVSAGCEVASLSRRQPNEIKIAVILPEYDTVAQYGLPNLKPAFEIAKESINATAGLLDGYNISFQFRDSNCSEVFAPLAAMDMYVRKEVDVFIGPHCHYAVSKVGNYATFWDIPAITSSMAWAFNKKEPFYKLLTRMMGDFRQPGAFMVRILENFHWVHVGMLVHNLAEGKSDEVFMLEGTYLLIKQNLDPDIKFMVTFDSSNYTEKELEEKLLALSEYCRGESHTGCPA